MEEAGKGVVKHVLIVKFKEEIPPPEIEQLIKDGANLVNLIPTMNSFHWGRDVGVSGMNEGFTHIFESTFDSQEGVAEYMSHPAHLDFANDFLPKLDKLVVIDYNPTSIH